MLNLHSLRDDVPHEIGYSTSVEAGVPQFMRLWLAAQTHKYSIRRPAMLANYNIKE
jgi:hypothetical protein